MKMPIKLFLTVLIGLIFLLSFSCGDDDDDATLSRDAYGGGGGGGSDDDDDTSDDDDTADDDASDDDTADDDTADDDDDDDTGDDPIIAFVYNNYPGTVTGFTGLLDVYGGFDYFMISEAEVTSTDFSNVVLIVVTSDTTWYNSAAVDLITDTLTQPVLALGHGGLTLYEQGEMTTGWNSQGTIYNQEDTAIVEDLGHSIFSGPHSVEIDNGQIELFAESVVLYAIPTYQFSENVDLLASAFPDPEHGAIQLERGRFMSWGYNFGIGNLSSNGANLFMNCVEWLSRQ